MYIVSRLLPLIDGSVDSLRRAHLFNCLRLCGKVGCAWCEWGRTAHVVAAIRQPCAFPLAMGAQTQKAWQNSAKLLLATCLRALQEFCKPLTDMPCRSVPQEKFAVVSGGTGVSADTHALDVTPVALLPSVSGPTLSFLLSSSFFLYSFLSRAIRTHALRCYDGNYNHSAGVRNSRLGACSL